MSLDDVSVADTIKLAGILESKFQELTEANTRLVTENDSLQASLDLVTGDRNYWRERAEVRERERDQARSEREYMLRQWQGVYAIAAETKAEIARTRLPQAQQQVLPAATKSLAS